MINFLLGLLVGWLISMLLTHIAEKNNLGTIPENNGELIISGRFDYVYRENGWHEITRIDKETLFFNKRKVNGTRKFSR